MNKDMVISESEKFEKYIANYFSKIFTNKNSEVIMGTATENKNYHTDIIIDRKDKDYVMCIDAKTVKCPKRSSKTTDDSKIWLEFLNNFGTLGWIFAQDKVNSMKRFENKKKIHMIFVPTDENRTGYLVRTADIVKFSVNHGLIRDNFVDLMKNRGTIDERLEDFLKNNSIDLGTISYGRNPGDYKLYCRDYNTKPSFKNGFKPYNRDLIAIVDLKTLLSECRNTKISFNVSQTEEINKLQNKLRKANGSI